LLVDTYYRSHNAKYRITAANNLCADVVGAKQSDGANKRFRGNYVAGDNDVGGN